MASHNSNIGFGGTGHGIVNRQASDRSVDADSLPRSRSSGSDLSAESFMMKSNGANFNSEQRPSQDGLFLRNQSTESFLTDDPGDDRSGDGDTPEAFTHLAETTATSNVFKQKRGSMEFDHPDGGTKSASPLDMAVIGDSGDMALQEINENAVIGGPTMTPKGKSRRKSDAQRTSFVKTQFLNLKEQRQWDKMMQHLNKIFDPAVAVTLKTYAKSEEFDFQAILDDIESYPEDPTDSNIIDHLKTKFNWNSKECDKFYRILIRILMDRALSTRTRSSMAAISSISGYDGTRRSASISRILGINMNADDLKENEESMEMQRPDIRRGGDEERMDTQQFGLKWSDEVVAALQKYCLEEEYDLEAIVEDLETYEEDNSMIIEDLAKQFGWNAQTANQFVTDLRRLISTDPVQSRRRFSKQ